jgi:hypothetical protein
MSETNYRANRLHRRLFLKEALAGAALAGAGLFEGTTSAVPAPKAKKKPKSCVLLWMSGGPSQIDTVDPKPDAPVAIRGAFGVIDTNVPGIRFCAHLPQLAKQADKLAVIRSANTADDSHDFAMYHMTTGYPSARGVVHPEMGAVVAKYLPRPNGRLPSFVSLGVSGNKQARPGEGFLGPAYQPLRLASHEAAPDGAIKKLCDIGKEWPKYKDVYGDTRFGKNCLAARRLVEAGVPFVEVDLGGFDAHARIAEIMRVRLRDLDPAWAGLLQDLHDRRLLENTLVVWMGEFGRSPTINQRAGRDHWTRGWSIVLAGGGIKAGMVYGATDKTGATIKENPVDEGDLLATIYTALGIDPESKNPAGAKNISLVPEEAKPIKALLA